MPFIQMPIGDVGESYPANSGTYDLRIVKVAEEASKKKREEEGEDCDPNMLVLSFAITTEGNEDVAPFRAWYMYPDGGDFDVLRMREIKRVLYWFGVAWEDTGFNTEDLENAEAQNIQVNKSINDRGREFNEAVFEPIPDEGEEGTEEQAEEEEAEVEEEAEQEEVVEEEEVEEAAPARKAPAKKPAAKVAAKPAKAAAKVAAKKPGRR